MSTYKCPAQIEMTVLRSNMKTVLSIIIFEVNISSHISNSSNKLIATLFCKIMKYSPSILVGKLHIKVMFTYKRPAQIDMVVSCCNMKTVISIICFEVNTNSHGNKKFNGFITALSRRIMKCCPSHVICHMHIKYMVI